MSLEALADQIIWGLHPVALSKNCGLCARFLNVKKLPTTILSTIYVVFMAILPTVLNYARGNFDWKVYTGWEVFLSIYYVVLMVCSSTVICVFWGLIIEVYEQQYNRAAFLSTLLDPVSSNNKSLPILDFRKPAHVMAWYQLHEYVTGFSARTFDFYANRFLIYVAALIGCIVFVVVQYQEGQLQYQGLFGSFTVITFLTFVMFFMLVLVFGFLCNNHLKSWICSLARTRVWLQEEMFALKHDLPAARMALDVEQIQQLNVGDGLARQCQDIEEAGALIDGVLAYLTERPLTSLLGYPLDSGAFSLIMSGATVLYAYIFPIFLQIFYDSPTQP